MKAFLTLTLSFFALFGVLAVSAVDSPPEDHEISYAQEYEAPSNMVLFAVEQDYAHLVTRTEPPGNFIHIVDATINSGFLNNHDFKVSANWYVPRSVSLREKIPLKLGDPLPAIKHYSGFRQSLT
ncbi:hypothetical protein [Jiulongibacter sediminis]|uniref:hypothetical protein n=1 Tax=Jiulongibacter sediminis TaxID=1605367 RepID=UPI0026EB36E9|nr:hypothetical protein [Jiulongibacter sediminis]